MIFVRTPENITKQPILMVCAVARADTVHTPAEELGKMSGDYSEDRVRNSIKRFPAGRF